MDAHESEAVRRFGDAFRRSHRTLLDVDPEFATWLATEWVPIAGAWQY
jgi:hypothetical protein